MKALILVDSRYGNTEELARDIAEALSGAFEVEVLHAPGQPRPQDVDLLLVGGPTEGHGLSVNLRASLLALRGGAFAGVKAAAFDTRFKMARWLTGSAAKGAASQLRKAGCELVAEPESFFVQGKEQPGTKKRGEPELLSGESDRARAWARDLAAKLAGAPATAGA